MFHNTQNDQVNPCFLKLFLIVALAVSTTLSLAQEKKPIHAPDALPGVELEMLTPDYWIGLNIDADNIIMTPEEIKEFNQKNRTNTRTNGYIRHNNCI